LKNAAATSPKKLGDAYYKAVKQAKGYISFNVEDVDGL
jgi:hypothetical protein